MTATRRWDGRFIPDRIGQYILAGLVGALIFASVSMFPSRKGCACERTTGHCECHMSGGKSR